MAKMKIEALNQRQQKRGISTRDRLIADLPRWAPRAARVSWLPGLRNLLPGAAKLSESWLGVSAKRTLPAFRADVFLGDVASRRGDAGDDADVVLFVDTFSNYFEPENARAAVSVLRAAGARIHVARPAATDSEPSRPLCCGRTYLAAGLVDEAKAEARRVVAALAPHVARGATVVGLEPSCLLSMRDEFLVMGLGDGAQQLGRQALLIEEFLVREGRAQPLAARLGPLPQKRGAAARSLPPEGVRRGVRNEGRLEPRSRASRGLRRIELLRDGRQLRIRCRALRRVVRMAELSLMPAVRAAAPDTLIVADGTSCRHQIADLSRAGPRREPIHVVRVLERALGNGA
jgi:Fe-S oxidoreductase